MLRKFRFWATVVVAALLVFNLGPRVLAQDGDDAPEVEEGDGAPEGEADDGAPKEGEPGKEEPGKKDPKADTPPDQNEPPAFRLSEKDRKKAEQALEKFLLPSKTSRSDAAKAFEKLDEKEYDGHSMLEDVETLADTANHSRVFGSKVGRKGAIVAVKVPPAVHGFPGGVGTVNYWLYLPKNYNEKELWPVLFALPDTKRYPDTSRYLKEVWLDKSEAIKDGFIVAVPTPSAKGKEWRTDPQSYARAMIALRHVVGTFEGDRHTAGPASDYTRVFLDGADTAALLGSRFAELFAGVILRGSDGTAGATNLRTEGQLNGLAAYCLVDPAKKSQARFADLVKNANEASVIVDAPDPIAADAEAIATWMTGLPPRAQPRTIQYTLQDSSFQRHHWINVLEFDGTLKQPPAGFSAACDRTANVVTIRSRGLVRFEVSLNDALVDLNRDLTIKVVDGDKELVAFQGKAKRDASHLLAELIDSNQPWRVYPVRISVDVPALRARAAETEAAAAAKAG